MPPELDIEKMNLEEGFCVIEAGAGAGKTYNLVRIVKKMSMEGTDISKILLVTFTNAAALEMRQRMRELLEKEGSPKALQELAAMQITTIHSFCHRAYAEYGTAAGFPAIEGAPEDSQALAQEIGLDFWRKKTREGSAPEVEPSEVVTAAELLLAETDAAGAETAGIRLARIELSLSRRRCQQAGPVQGLPRRLIDSRNQPLNALSSRGPTDEV